MPAPIVPPPITSSLLMSVHHTLRPTGRPRRVDQQRNIVAGVRRNRGQRHRGVVGARRRQVIDIEGVEAAQIGAYAVVHHQPGCRVGDLVPGLVGSEGRIDWGDDGTEPPGGHHQPQAVPADVVRIVADHDRLLGVPLAEQIWT
jgi:hypothetical protein